MLRTRTYSILGLLAVGWISACAGMSEDRRNCISHCSGENDACIVHAMDSDSLQHCDMMARACNESCSGR